MRFHLLAMPNVQTTSAYELDGFCTATIRFAKLLKALGHTVFLYAGEENEAPCDELIPCISKREQIQYQGPPEAKIYQNANIDPTNPLWKLATPRMIAEIGKRKQPHDIIASLGGGSQHEVMMMHPDLMDLEYSIGYVGNCSRYRVYQSQAWRHVCMGLQKIDMVRFFDDVIPGFFEREKFPVNPPEDYIVYVGRYTERKGINVVCQAAKLAGVNVKFIGHGTERIPSYGENLGAVDEATRNEVMSKAKALICPTCYVEPFGCISPEAQMCGTPVISTDAGGFTETVEHGYTGFRCNILGEFVDAIKKVDTLDRHYIRERAHALFSMEAAAVRYEAYFQRMMTMWGKGWNTEDFLVQ